MSDNELHFIVIGDNEQKFDEWTIYSDAVPRVGEYIKTGLDKYVVIYIEYNHIVEDKKVSNVNVFIQRTVY